MLITLSAKKRLSITPNRGKEFSNHEHITAALDGLPFYFTNPHATWEKGTNENTNGLILEYCPKSVDMNVFPNHYFGEFIDKLNHRPRKCLGWESLFDVFFDNVLYLA